MISDQKAIIAVPSYAQAVAWKDTVTPPPDVIDAVEQFKKSAPPAKLLMVARFDGVDFPGDTCRVMVLDGVPRGVSILERYLVERLGIKKVIVSQVASRVFQWFGRICRGKRDVGVFFVLSTDLREWLSEHGALLPSFLQNQISLGRDISGKVTKVESAGGLNALRIPGSRVFERTGHLCMIWHSKSRNMKSLGSTTLRFKSLRRLKWPLDLRIGFAIGIRFLGCLPPRCLTSFD